MSSEITQQALPTGTWSVDKIHSTVGFALKYMAGTFQGTFSDFGARLDDEVFSGSAEVASIQGRTPTSRRTSRARTPSTPSASRSSASWPGM